MYNYSDPGMGQVLFTALHVALSACTMLAVLCREPWQYTETRKELERLEKRKEEQL